jgi:hypothetical protein
MKMALFLGTALFLATIAVALWAIAITVLGALPRIVEVLGELAPEPQPRATLAPVRLAVRH